MIVRSSCTCRTTPSTGRSSRRAAPISSARTRPGMRAIDGSTRRWSRPSTRARARSARALERAGLLDKTLFIFSNDNGGEVRLTSNRPLFHHKATVWEGESASPASSVGRVTSPPAL